MFDIVAICLLSVHETYNNKNLQMGITFMWVCIVTMRSSDSKGHKIDILGSIRVSATTTWENSEPREACAMSSRGPVEAEIDRAERAGRGEQATVGWTDRRPGSPHSHPHGHSPVKSISR